MDTTVLGRVRSVRGWRPQPPDARDLDLMAHGPVKTAVQHLPRRATTRTIAAPPIRDQGVLGSCTANAGTTAAGYLIMKRTGHADPVFSRLFMYAATRKLEGVALNDDSGCFVRDVFKAMRRWGVCFESTWPYDEHRFSDEPPAPAYQEVLNHRALVFYACRSLTAIKQSIADGYPVIGGFTCFESLFHPTTERTGHIPMPRTGEEQEGGHCVYFDTYDDETDELGLQNSWGPGWGAGGYGTLPQDFVRSGLATDFHTLRIEATAQ